MNTDYALTRTKNVDSIRSFCKCFDTFFVSANMEVTDDKAKNNSDD